MSRHYRYRYGDSISGLFAAAIFMLIVGFFVNLKFLHWNLQPGSMVYGAACVLLPLVIHRVGKSFD
jgi:hypothetical protein